MEKRGKGLRRALEIILEEICNEIEKKCGRDISDIIKDLLEGQV